jgi:preprotein translocase subunit SecG
MNKALVIIQICVGALLTASILLQSKGAALGETFGGNSVFFGSRRGAEKTLFIITIILAVLFVGLAYALLFF